VHCVSLYTATVSLVTDWCD